MKISMVTSQFLPAVSGVTFYILDLCKDFTKMGHDVTVHTPFYPNLKKEEVIEGIKIKRYPGVKIQEGFTISGCMIKGILKEKSDIINSHHYGYYPCYAGFVSSKLNRTPHVFTPVLHPPVFSFKRSVLFYSYHFTMGLPTLRYSDKLLALSNYETKILERLGGKKEKMDVIYNPVDTDFFRPLKNKDEKTVLFVAPFESAKGADVLFNTAKEILQERRDVKFVFIGHGSFEEYFKKEAKKYPGRFLFLDRIPKKDLALWYSKSTVLVMPTQYEAFGKVFAEAQSCGTPAIGTRVGSVPEVIKNNETGYVINYGNWKSLKEKIIYLLDNPSIARKMGLDGRKRVVENFDKSLFTERHLRIFKELM